MVFKFGKEQRIVEIRGIRIGGQPGNYQQLLWAVYSIYGSIAKAKDVFPPCAMADAIVAYNARTLGLRPLTKNHPLYRILQYLQSGLG